MERTVVGIGILALMAGCSSPKRAVGVQKVDTLLSHMESLSLNAERTRSSANRAVLDLRALSVGDYERSAVEAYEAFLGSLDVFEDHLTALHFSVPPMHDAANRVYAQWSDDLIEFSSPSMRERSRQRRDETVDRYSQVLLTVDPALDGYGLLLARLRDHALFLSTDLNAETLDDMREELDGLRSGVIEVDRRAEDLIDASRAYVQASAPAGEVRVVEEDEPMEREESEAKARDNWSSLSLD